MKRLMIIALIAFSMLALAGVADAQGFRNGRRGDFHRGQRFFRPRPQVVFVPQPSFFQQQQFFAPQRRQFFQQPRHVIVIDQFGRQRIIHNHPPQFRRF